jgi:hypothetical protein
MAQPDPSSLDALATGRRAYNAWLSQYAKAHPGSTIPALKAAWREEKARLRGRADPTEAAVHAPTVGPAEASMAAAPANAPADAPADSDEEAYYRQVLQASGADADDGKPLGKFQIEPLSFAFESVFALLAGFLGPWWALAPKEAARIARAWRAWVKSLPKRQAQFLLRLERDVMPTLSLAGTLMGVIIPRWELTMQARRGERPGQTSAPRPSPRLAPSAREAAEAVHGPAVTNGGPRGAPSGIVPAGTPGRDPFAQELAEESEHGEAA